MWVPILATLLFLWLGWDHRCRKRKQLQDYQMPELTFGEKLILARKQLNLYQYQMAEKLGVHPNSIWK